jgi:hypothetical protein
MQYEYSIRMKKIRQDDTPKPGRRPIGPQITIRLPQAMLDAMDEVAGKGKRATFIRLAIERELKRSR